MISPAMALGEVLSEEFSISGSLLMLIGEGFNLAPWAPGLKTTELIKKV